MDKIAAEAAKEIAETTFFAGTNPRWQQEQLEKKIFAALSQSLAEREQRIAELEAALRDMLEGHEDEDPNRPCIANARAALASTEGEKRE